jgi:serine/threonine-protein kinase
VLSAAIYFVMRPKQLPATISTPTGEMVLVPAGQFLQGKDKQRVSLVAFYIDKTEVTNKAYQAFCSDMHRAEPKGFPADKPNYPVVNVSFDDAVAFATWAGKRLPQPNEWEKAARGTDGRRFPWGDNADESLANIHSQSLQPADFPRGESPFHALNMLGNAWEWVDHKTYPDAGNRKYFEEAFPDLKPDDPYYEMRGLGYKQPLMDSALWEDGVAPAMGLSDVGFRCVAYPEQALALSNRKR